MIHEMSADGVTVLVSTHYMDEAERCQRVVYLADGRLVVQGTAEEVVRAVIIIIQKIFPMAGMAQPLSDAGGIIARLHTLPAGFAWPVALLSLVTLAIITSRRASSGWCLPRCSRYWL